MIFQVQIMIGIYSTAWKLLQVYPLNQVEIYLYLDNFNDTQLLSISQ